VTFFEIRFAGELSPFAAVFVAIGTLWLLSWIDLGSTVSPLETQSRYRLSSDVFQPSSETAYVAGALLLIASLGLLLGPAAMDTVAQTDGQVEVVGWMAEDSVTNDRDEFVASQWGEQRFYNYHVFGESDSYRTGVQDDIEALYGSSTPDAEYGRFSSGIGYLVFESLEDVPENTGPEEGYTRLVEHYGSATSDADGVGHYRVQFVSSDGEYLVFTPVSGATIRGSGPVDERFDVSTDVAVPGASFTYTRYVDTATNGTYTVRVAHPGSYEVGERGTVTVTEEDVRQGHTVNVTRTDS
jgi:dolichyl-diphosphooligosaccharide--protein glycosyltransferase